MRIKEIDTLSIKGYFRKNFSLIFVSFILLILPFFWFSNNEVIFFHDEGIPFNSIKAIEFTNIWASNYELGTTTSATSKSIGFFIFSLLSYIFGFSLAEKIIYAILIVLGYIGFYLFARDYVIKKNNFLLITLSFVLYFFSLEVIYSVFRVNYIMSRLFFISLFPLLLYLFLRLVNYKKKSTFFWFILTTIVFNSALAHPSIVMLFFILFPMIILIELHSSDKLNKKTIFLSLILIFIMILILTYSIIPKLLILSDGIENLAGGKKGILIELTDYSKFHSIGNSLISYPVYPIIGESTRIRWYLSDEWFRKASLKIILTIIPLVILISLFYKPPKKFGVYTLIFLSLLFLNKGLNLPFPFIYKFFIENTSLLDPFRYLEKWTIVIPFFSSILLLMGLDKIYKKNYKVYWLLFIMLSLIPIYLFILFSLQGGIFSTATIPSTNQTFYSKMPLEEIYPLVHLNNNLKGYDPQGNYRILFYPPFDKFIYFNEGEKYYVKGGSANPFNLIFNAPIISVKNLQSPLSTEVWKKSVEFLEMNENNTNFCKELGKYNFKYVLTDNYILNNKCLDQIDDYGKYIIYKNIEWNDNFFTDENGNYIRYNLIYPSVYFIEGNQNIINVNWEFRPGWLIIPSQRLTKFNDCVNNNYTSFLCITTERDNEGYYLVYYKDILFKGGIIISFILTIIIYFVFIKKVLS